MNDEIVLALFIKDNVVIPYSDNESMLHEYAEFIGAKEYGIQEMRFGDLANYCNDNDLIFSELTELKAGCVITEDELEMVSNSLEQDAYALVKDLKSLKRKIKFVKGETSVELSNAIDNFLKERVPCKDYIVDASSKVERVIERIKLRKYARHCLCYDKKKGAK